MSQEEKDKIKEYQRKKYQELVQYKKKRYKINNFCFFLSIKLSNEKILKFNNIRVNKKEFHKCKKAIDLISVNVNQILYLRNLNIVTKVLNVLLVTKKMKLLNCYVLSYLK